MANYKDEVELTQSSLVSALGRLSDIRESFVEVAKLFRDVEGINKRYAEIIKGALPTFGQDAEYKFDAEEADDKAYFKAISKLFDRIPDEERLNALIALVKDIKPPLADYRRKVAKLENTVKKLPATVKDESGNMVPNPELQVAKNRLVKCRQTVEVLEARLKDACTRFLKFRRTMLKRIFGASEVLAELFKADEVMEGFDPDFREWYGKSPLGETMDDFKELERRIIGRKATR